MNLKNIEKKYILKNKQVFALNKINLNINEKKYGIYLIQGHSGSGKTTLLQILGLLDNFDSGDYKIDGISVSSLKEKEKSELRYKKFGFVFQDYHLLDNLKAYENVMVPMYLNDKMNNDERKNKAIQLLKDVGLEDRIEHFPKEMSGGEQQRVAIARALANDPNVLLADEPTGNLDVENEIIIFDLFKKISKKKCIIMVSHNLNALKYADKVYMMEGGKINEK